MYWSVYYVDHVLHGRGSHIQIWDVLKVSGCMTQEEEKKKAVGAEVCKMCNCSILPQEGNILNYTNKTVKPNNHMWP